MWFFLKFGVFIEEINCVCKYFFCVKGGWLVVVVYLVLIVIFVIFDVLGDDLFVIVFGLMVVDLIILEYV